MSKQRLQFAEVEQRASLINAISSIATGAAGATLPTMATARGSAIAARYHDRDRDHHDDSNQASPSPKKRLPSVAPARARDVAKGIRKTAGGSSSSKKRDAENSKNFHHEVEPGFLCICTVCICFQLCR